MRRFVISTEDSSVDNSNDDTIAGPTVDSTDARVEIFNKENSEVSKTFRKEKEAEVTLDDEELIDGVEKPDVDSEAPDTDNYNSDVVNAAGGENDLYSATEYMSNSEHTALVNRIKSTKMPLKSQLEFLIALSTRSL